jgi:leader peptidase (prepilin peptidase)/N-methyltransferase
MLFTVWIVFFFVMLFLLGSTVGSFLNVCIVRLPQGRSLIRPASCCGQCGKPIRWQDNIPLVSYWVLRGRCRACGAPFSIRYFWIELLTGLLFVAIFHLEIGRNIHHFDVWIWYENDYEFVLTRMFDPLQWLVFSTHAVLGCLLIVATACIWEHGRVPGRVTAAGVFLGLLAALLFPWPWPDPPSQAVVSTSWREINLVPEVRAFSWGPRVGVMPSDRPWEQVEATPRQGLYPWPVWGPPPDGLTAGSRRLGLATGLAGVVAGAVSMALVRLVCNAGTGTQMMGWGETSLLAMAGGFLGWQPTVTALLAALVPGLSTMTWQWARGRRQTAFVGWLTAALVGVWFGWFWIGPLVQGLFFHPRRLLWLAVFPAATLLVFTAGWCLATLARFIDSRETINRAGPK